jgi:hypothetical protein
MRWWLLLNACWNGVVLDELQQLFRTEKDATTNLDELDPAVEDVVTESLVADAKDFGGALLVEQFLEWQLNMGRFDEGALLQVILRYDVHVASINDGGLATKGSLHSDFLLTNSDSAKSRTVLSCARLGGKASRPLKPFCYFDRVSDSFRIADLRKLRNNKLVSEDYPVVRVGCVGLAHRAGADSTTAFGSTFGKYIVERSSNACRMLTKTNDCTKDLEIASGDWPNRILQARNVARKVVMVGPPSR